MADDPLSLPLTPPTKRMRVVAVKPSYSDLMAAFGATRSQSSVTKMARDSSRALRQTAPVSYAESDNDSTSQPSPQSSTFTSPNAISQSSTDPSTPESELQGPETPGIDDEDDELQTGDTIQVAPRRATPSRTMPARSSKVRLNYAKPLDLQDTRRAAKKHSKKAPLKKLLASNASTRVASSKARPENESSRNKIRNDIDEYTKPKRDAFLLANRDRFQPLLPENNYINKLEQRQSIDRSETPTVSPYESIAVQPPKVKATMKPYQLEGLSFLVHMYNNGMSAVLGDEMGLGKTLQTLSLFEYLTENHPNTGEPRPYLVVCPLSVLSSWVNEAKKWCPHLNVLRFHGPKTERERYKREATGMIDRFGNTTTKGATRASLRKAADDDAPIDLIITSYETFVAEQGWFKRAFVWRYCVLDEGHKIKNDKSNVSSALQGLNAEHRLLLTGTPLQNNLHEMWALLHWLLPDVFTPTTADRFKDAFNLTQGKVSTAFMDNARYLLELIMLRRMKSSPGVNLGLPPKEEILLFVPLTPMQRFWYTRLLTRAGNGVLDDLFKNVRSKEMQALKQGGENDEQLNFLEEVNDRLEQNAGNPDVWAESKQIISQAIENETQDEQKSYDWKKLMNLMMQLRKTCNHPYILPNASPEPYYLGDHVRINSGKFIILDKLVKELVLKRGKKILIFSGFTKMLDLCEDLLALQGANANDAPFRYLRLDGSTARARRNLGIRMFNDPESEFKIMLISTRAGGLGINLASASDVVFMDEDWNPQVTLQAEARAHRIGQNQKVTIYKLCTQGTVEEQMMGRIRKKLYLSAKITESMRSVHSMDQSKKRKRGTSDGFVDDDAPHLGTSELKSLIRRGAQTLSRPQVDVEEMLEWDWQTTLEKCKDSISDPHAVKSESAAEEDVDEESWLNEMEKVETAVFEGQKHQRQIEKEMKENQELVHSDRRIGKNTTVMIDGFAINKESMNCADWEAVPTMAGKDPRLAEPVRAKKPKIEHQDYCQTCRVDSGELYLCSGCPRAYHYACFKTPEWKAKAKAKMQFHCSQHECVECEKKTGEAGGMVYRCRWCEKAYCEDCLDWETVKLVGETLPELEMLGLLAHENAWFVDCPSCIAQWKEDPADKKRCEKEKKEIEIQYKQFLAAQQDHHPEEEEPKTEVQQHEQMKGNKKQAVSLSSPDTLRPSKKRKLEKSVESSYIVGLTGNSTPDTVSEVATPFEAADPFSRAGGSGIVAASAKKAKQGLLASFKNKVLDPFVE